LSLKPLAGKCTELWQSPATVLGGGFRNAGKARIVDGLKWVAEALPLFVSAAQRAHALNAKLVKCHGCLGSGSLTGACAEQHDVAIARNLIMAGSQRLR